MVSAEGVKGPQLHPASAQLFRAVAEEAADVCANVRNAEQIELQHT